MSNTIRRFLLPLLLLCVHQLFGQTGILEKVITSTVLKREVKYAVFLPPGYTAAKVYPVIFYFHEFGVDHHSAKGFMDQVNKMIVQHSFQETIIIAPDAGNSWYIDDYAGQCRYASMLMNEFLPAVQKQFSISTVPANRAVMGMSMGGFGALRVAILAPGNFGVCVSLMGAIMTKEQARDDPYYEMFHKGLYGKELKGEQRVNAWFLDNNPLYMIGHQDPKVMSGVKWYIQYCDQDFHSLSNAALHIAMRERGIPHEYRVSSGDHTGEYYQAALPEAIDFIRRAFQKGSERDLN